MIALPFESQGSEMNNKFGISRSNLNIVAGIAAILLAIPLSGVAQEITSAIRGKVNDATGEPVAGASVVVEDMRTGVERNYATNDSGVFLATRLPVGGPYRVTVSGTKSVDVPSIALGDTYALTINMQSGAEVEEIVVIGTTAEAVDVAIGPASTYSSFDLETNIAFERDIVDVYALDPRFNVDNTDDGFAINCMGMNPRFNSVTLDGVSMNDRFGLNDNGYATATGMPFPYDALEQVSVELSPFDATYGGFSACNINAVTKSGTNNWEGGVFYEYTSDSLRGDTINEEPLVAPPYNENKYGFNVGGPIIKDKLFVFAAYEKSDEARFISQGHANGSGVLRPWLSEADYNLIRDTAISTYDYDPGGQPSDGAQENEKYMVKLDWNINEDHNATLIYNYLDGFQDRDSDGDSDEFEFANHFYQKGAEGETITLKVDSQWNDWFSTEFFYSVSEMNDSQITVGPKDFGDHQLSLPDGDVYLGADDSRQANALSTESNLLKLSAQFLIGNHVITAGYDRDDLEIFNMFVQHSNGGEWDYYGVEDRDDDGTDEPNPPECATLDAAGRFANPDCHLSAIDQFVLGRPSRIYYGSGGGTNDPTDAAARFSNVNNAFYVQDEIFFDDIDLTIIAGLRYEWFDSDDRPVYNDAFTQANGIRNDYNIDGVDILMPRLGFTWGVRDDLTLRGGIGLYSGGNPNVWISNAWSNDGVTNVQVQWFNFEAQQTVLDGSVPLSRQGRPGYDVPQSLVDQVAATTAADASDERLVIIDPNYKQPGLWKYTLGATWDIPWGGITADFDYIHSEQQDPAQYVDLSQSIVNTTIVGTPIYDYTVGEDNYMLTNSVVEGSGDLFSVQLYKDFDNGLDIAVGYAYADAEDVMPMTSSVAQSNWENLATSDVNFPLPATSNYVVPHRFTFRVSYGAQLIGDLTSRFTAYGYVAEGQPQSYVMGNDGEFEAGGFFGRHLLYVPDGPSDPNVVFTMPQEEQDAFFDFIRSAGLRPGIQPRNAQHAPWSNRIDIRIDQDIPTFFDGTSGRLFLKIYNFGNFLNSDWGDVNDAQFFSVQVIDADVDDVTGQFIFEEFHDRSIVDLREDRSLWEARFGIDIFFGE
jgi:outer membrane receptor for ferrienterochelin and colicin